MMRVNVSFEVETPDQIPAAMKGEHVLTGATLVKVLDHLIRNQKILAIKELKSATGWGLKESKDKIDQVFQHVGQAYIDRHYRVCPECHSMFPHQSANRITCRSCGFLL